LFDCSSDLSVKHLNTTYEFSLNKKFNIEKLFSLNYIVSLSHRGDDKDFIQKFCVKQSIQVEHFKNYSYDQAIYHLIKSTPYFVKCIDDGDVAYDGEPLKKFISGYDYYSIVLLSVIFDNIEFLSATYADYHYDIWDCFGNMNVKKKDLDPRPESYKDDFGVILFTNKSMTPSLLDSISSNLGFIILFLMEQTKIVYKNYLSSDSSTS